MSTTETTPLIPQLEELDAHLRNLQTKAEALRALTPEQWLWSPGPKVWSVALVLDHLNVVERDIMPPIEAAVETLRRDNLRSDGPFHYRWTERFFIRMLSPNPPFKSPVPPKFTPKAPADPIADTLDPYLEVLNRFQRIVERANGYDLKALKVTSTVSKVVKMAVGAYMEAMVAHERYHWTQIDALLANPAFPRQPHEANP